MVTGEPKRGEATATTTSPDYGDHGVGVKPTHRGGVCSGGWGRGDNRAAAITGLRRRTTPAQRCRAKLGGWTPGSNLSGPQRSPKFNGGCSLPTPSRYKRCGGRWDRTGLQSGRGHPSLALSHPDFGTRRLAVRDALGQAVNRQTRPARAASRSETETGHQRPRVAAGRPSPGLQELAN